MSAPPVLVDDMVRQRPAKLCHKKVRTGCQRCRARRVKCDEAKPICSNCTRLSLACAYGDIPRRGDAPVNPDGVGVDLVESEARRKLELELFYHYFAETGPTLAADEISLPLWVPVMCRLALKSDALLYSIFLMSSLHKAKKSKFNDKAVLRLGCNYLTLALKEHQRDIARLNAANMDAACLVSCVLRVYGFIRLQDRPLEPYTPPIDWLRMTGTSNVVGYKALALAKGNPDSVVVRFLATITHLLDEKRQRQHFDGLMHLLRRQEPHELVEAWDAQVYDVYESTLNAIGAIWKAVRDHDSRRSLTRRLIVFPMLVDQRFVDFVEEQRPRALVILAHYFALLAALRRLWWIGDAGPREFHAIVNRVPAEWHGQLRWPLEIVQDRLVLGDEARDPTGVTQSSLAAPAMADP